MSQEGAQQLASILRRLSGHRKAAFFMNLVLFKTAQNKEKLTKPQKVRHYDYQCEAVSAMAGIMEKKIISIEMKALYRLKQLNEKKRKIMKKGQNPYLKRKQPNTLNFKKKPIVQEPEESEDSNELKKQHQRAEMNQKKPQITDSKQNRTEPKNGQSRLEQLLKKVKKMNEQSQHIKESRLTQKTNQQYIPNRNYSQFIMSSQIRNRQRPQVDDFKNSRSYISLRNENPYGQQLRMNRSGGRLNKKRLILQKIGQLEQDLGNYIREHNEMSRMKCYSQFSSPRERDWVIERY